MPEKYRTGVSLLGRYAVLPIFNVINVIQAAFSELGTLYCSASRRSPD